MTLPNVPNTFISPRYDDKVVQDLQLSLSNLVWLNKSYHIARIGVNSLDKTTYPQIQANDGSNELFDIRPDNKCSAYSFFEVDKPYQANTYDGDLTCYLSLIVWGNLNLIDPMSTNDFTGTLINDVVNLLKRSGVESMEIEENPEKIFNKYSALKQEHNQYLLRRYTAFKISFYIKTGLINECNLYQNNSIIPNNSIITADTIIRDSINGHRWKLGVDSNGMTQWIDLGI